MKTQYNLPKDMATMNHNDKHVQLGAEETFMIGIRLTDPERFIFRFIRNHI